LGAGRGPRLGRVVVVDDRGRDGPPIALDALGGAAHEAVVVRGRARGPAAARNLGWRTCTGAWVAFLDDDVVPEPGWREALARDLDGLGGEVAGSQGRIVVPLP